jgi:hypothetical protein
MPIENIPVKDEGLQQPTGTMINKGTDDEKVGQDVNVVNDKLDVNQGALQADNSLLNPTGDSVQSWDHVDGAIVSGSPDPNVTFDQNATGNLTLTTVSYSAITNPTKEYLLSVRNTSAVVGVTITVIPLEPVLDGGTQNAVLTSFDVPVQSTRAVLLRGILTGIDCMIIATPDAAISDANASNRKITMRLRKY